MEGCLFCRLFYLNITWFTLNRIAMCNEEKRNVERFGQEYVDYMKKVPRFLPGRRS